MAREGVSGGLTDLIVAARVWLTNRSCELPKRGRWRGAHTTNEKHPNESTIESGVGANLEAVFMKSSTLHNDVYRFHHAIRQAIRVSPGDGRQDAGALRRSSSAQHGPTRPPLFHWRVTVTPVPRRLCLSPLASVLSLASVALARLSRSRRISPLASVLSRRISPLVSVLSPHQASRLSPLAAAVLSPQSSRRSSPLAAVPAPQSSRRSPLAAVISLQSSRHSSAAVLLSPQASRRSSFDAVLSPRPLAAVLS